ncbi:RagB/SusD family nutrient uptake outer membrane protein [Chitinophaga cymbidii]|uniref:Membrane protein n=1 Tax=Chitinophaga cymbidii TaxID=1096750 RepID=A0A512RPN5_9BACT|nr:RagB/SusD family nutrient uptake outer membrane protein [Chitinophaga cymbidii]GEP97656.1 membrane protein [Chitinophaga cymbidii]
MKNIIKIYVIALLAATTGCAKFVELDPPVNSISDRTAYTTNATATSVLTGILYNMTVNTDFVHGSSGVGLLTGMGSDELKYYQASQTYSEFAKNSLLADNSYVLGIWVRCYKLIYAINAAIEGVTASPTISEPVKQQLTGEAKFLRAFCYFYLVNLYGDVPVPTTTDYKVNITLPRKPVQDVYQQIIQDLKDAQSLLRNEYLSATNVVTTDRVRPNKFAATALLARAYLYAGDWANAEMSATEVINQAETYKMDNDLNQTFLVNSREAIWQLGLAANGSGVNTWDGNILIIRTSPVTGYPGLSLSETQMDVLEGDKRQTNWTNLFIADGTGYPYPFKYKVYQAAGNSATTEHTMVLRLAEQYLIRAEAKAMQGRISGTDGGMADINAVRSRADQTEVTATTLQEFMLALERERRLELFTEMGHRWFDIKRWKGFSNTSITRADEIMPAIAAAKGGVWKPEYKLWPIPSSELKVNVHLTPNPGYGL